MKNVKKCIEIFLLEIKHLFTVTKKYSEEIIIYLLNNELVKKSITLRFCTNEINFNYCSNNIKKTKLKHKVLDVIKRDIFQSHIFY